MKSDIFKMHHFFFQVMLVTNYILLGLLIYDLINNVIALNFFAVLFQFFICVIINYFYHEKIKYDLKKRFFEE